MSCPASPDCGNTGNGSPLSVTTLLALLLGGIGTASKVLPAVIKLILRSVSSAGAVSTPVFLGVSAPAAIWAAGIFGAVLTLAVVGAFYYLRCLSNPKVEEGCSAGVISQVVPAFSSTSSILFPFTAIHDRIDVVVKCSYWGKVTGGNPAWVWCNDDPDQSPILRGYYYNSTVCAAGLGSVIGAAAGAVGGILAAAAIAAAIGCATIFLCILAVLLAILVAAAVVLIGAFIGGQIGAGAGNAFSGSSPLNTLNVGDYVSTCGDLTNSTGGIWTTGEDQGARVYWFINKTVQHGYSSASPPYDHTDPDANLNPDACPNC